MDNVRTFHYHENMTTSQNVPTRVPERNDRNDSEMLNLLRDAERSGTRVGINQTKILLGVGSGRAKRLVELLHAERSGHIGTDLPAAGTNMPERSGSIAARLAPIIPVGAPKDPERQNVPTEQPEQSGHDGTPERSVAREPERQNIPSLGTRNDPGNTVPSIPIVPFHGSERNDPVEQQNNPPEHSPGTETAEMERNVPGETRRPVLLLAGLYVIIFGAFVAIWSGWVGLGEMCGYGTIHPFPGILDGFTINVSVSLPLGVEAFAFVALSVWINGNYGKRAERFSAISTMTSLTIGAAGQIAFHLLNAYGHKTAPWQIVTFVSVLPVLVLAMAGTLAHIVITERKSND